MTAIYRVTFSVMKGDDRSTAKALRVVDMTHDQYERWFYAEQKRVEAELARYAARDKPTKRRGQRNCKHKGGLP